MSDQKVGAVLVVGGGISGIQSALDLAESGFKVYLLDKGPSIGGVMAQLDKTFPTNDCAMCIMAPKLVSTGRHPNITLITNGEIENLEGTAGSFRLTIKRRARYVDEKKCTGCGVCVKLCPVEAIDEYNEGLKVRKGIFVRYPQAVPLVYAIDRDKCIGCGVCQTQCIAEAIDYAQEDEYVKLDVGSIVLALGFEEFDPKMKREYGYGRYPNVVSSIEFERILSATGPSRGVVIRPSDGEIPRRVAFIQCVGSRDEQAGNAYCSSVCCMYSMKQAIVAKEHTPDLDAHIFFMDVRAFGKEFQDYYRRAEKELGIKFTRCRAAEINEETKTNNLLIRYVKGEELTEEVFDMAVLALGLQPPSDAKEISEKMGVKLNNYDFCDTTPFTPLETSRPGIYVSGAFTGPKDIPDCVAQGSAAAAKASSIIVSERGKLATTKDYPPERDVETLDPRIGVFICNCGINIGGIVDTSKVVRYANSLPGVVWAEENLFTCSEETQGKIKQKINELELNRVVVASCTPRTHEPLFRECVREAGLNVYLFEMANIRDHCSWVHMHEPTEATEKAKDLVRMAVAKARLLRPLKRIVLTVAHSALVIGGGSSGITAALELAAQGFHVHLLEREAFLGGNLRKIHFLNDGQDPHEFLDSLIEKATNDNRITVHLNTQLTSVDGCVGNFDVSIEEDGKESRLMVGAIVIATGGEELKPTTYLYGTNQNILTQLEFEDRLYRNQVDADCIAMIQCVGSTNEDRRYCSRVCCTHAVRNALEFKKRNPEADVYILHKDMMTYGFNEDLYREASKNGVVFIRYNDENTPKVTGNNGLMVMVDDPVLQERIQIKPSLLILSTAIAPRTDNLTLSQMLKVPLSKDGFFLEAHMKLRPVDFATDGVFLCGLAHSPKSIDESIVQATAAAQRASTILCKDTVEAEGIVAFVDDELCIGCRACDICPFNAIEMVEKKISLREFNYYTRKARVNEVLCKGCGKCASICPRGAVDVRHFSDRQIASQISAAIEVVSR